MPQIIILDSVIENKMQIIFYAVLLHPIFIYFKIFHVNVNNIGINRLIRDFIQESDMHAEDTQLPLAVEEFEIFT